MNIKPYSVRHPLLQKHIDSYYLLKSGDDFFDSRYFAFPSNLTPLSIHKHARTEIKEYSTFVCADPAAPPVIIVQGMRNRPLFAHLTGPLDKVTVVFKPLGINRFMSRSFNTVCPEDSQIFTEWETAPGYAQFISDFYRLDDENSRISTLENFLLTVYNPQAHFPGSKKRSICSLISITKEKSRRSAGSYISTSAL